MSFLRMISMRNSIHRKIFLSFVLVMLIPSIAIGVSTYYISINILKDKVSSSFSQTVYYVNNALERELDQVRQILDYIFVDEAIKNAILPDGKSEYDSLKDAEKVEQIIKNYSIANIFRNINTIRIYGFTGAKITYSYDGNTLLYDDEKIIQSKGYAAALDHSGEIIWSGTQEQFVRSMSPDYPKEISLFRTIKDSGYQSDIGVIYVNLKSSVFSSLVERIGLVSDGSIFIFDNNNDIVSLPYGDSDIRNLDNLYTAEVLLQKTDFIISKNNHLFINYSVPEYGWRVIGVIPLADLMKDNQAIFYVSGIVFLICFIFSSIIWYYISSSIVRPIKNMTKTVKSIREGNLHAKVNCTSKDEIGILGNNFNFMLDRINLLFEEVIQKQARLREAEYKALQSQINPHFLYNTLNSIRWMAIIQKADNIKRVVDALGSLLKYSTSKVDPVITIKEELDNLKDYIFIQKIAYKSKFDVEWKIDQTILQNKCIKFILQPIVENAIIHGIQPKESFGNILIHAYQEDNQIVFCINDDGVGMTQSQIDTILQLNCTSEQSLCGIGIGNVQERIQMTYGSPYGIEIDSDAESYTSVYIKIPVIT